MVWGLSNLLSNIRTISFDKHRDGKKLVIEWGDNTPNYADGLPLMPGSGCHHANPKRPSIDDLFDLIHETLERNEKASPAPEPSDKAKKIKVD